MIHFQSFLGVRTLFAKRVCDIPRSLFPHAVHRFGCPRRRTGFRFSGTMTSVIASGSRRWPAVFAFSTCHLQFPTRCGILCGKLMISGRFSVDNCQKGSDWPAPGRIFLVWKTGEGAPLENSFFRHRLLFAAGRGGKLSVFSRWKGCGKNPHFPRFATKGPREILFPRFSNRPATIKTRQTKTGPVGICPAGMGRNPLFHRFHTPYCGYC